MTPLHKHGVNNNRAVAAQSSPLVPPSTVCLQLPQASEHGGILGPLDSPLRCASATPPRKLTAVPPMSARHQWGMMHEARRWARARRFSGQAFGLWPHGHPASFCAMGITSPSPVVVPHNAGLQCNDESVVRGNMGYWRKRGQETKKGWLWERSDMV
eukprot:CAMPEP_0174303852 /NCGR_PEP_ID=MMETSP0809-20121228/60435_1 /TAXON_ID=73025 ORGANISM="Eutreptiella gymnastica-like, Strain CCMP1594" /NCGR_SAMPLE_ID=MMETSP0809 /ASSEMBLY_ACC=CAM_ASM_000658 /LENGTH=156 /DNA_ID=CAMNT_0015409959 /DNA_START=886 /DNA_END=1357 /DNA_ORIENTATION=-